MPTCSTCRRPKPKSAFHKNRARSTGIGSVCKGCQKLRGQDPVYLAKARDRALNRTLKLRGMSTLEYQQRLVEQDERCAICGKPEITQSKNGHQQRLAVDHSHETNQTRSLLCSYCNGVLGLFEKFLRQPNLQQPFADYLRHWDAILAAPGSNQTTNDPPDAQ
jgi:hypothetical protein